MWCFISRIHVYIFDWKDFKSKMIWTITNSFYVPFLWCGYVHLLLQYHKENKKKQKIILINHRTSTLENIINIIEHKVPIALKTHHSPTKCLFLPIPTELTTEIPNHNNSLQINNIKKFCLNDDCNYSHNNNSSN